MACDREWLTGYSRANSSFIPLQNFRVDLLARNHQVDKSEVLSSLPDGGWIDFLFAPVLSESAQ
jgi:hypothetical protein